jgi:hypothetical protein
MLSSDLGIQWEGKLWTGSAFSVCYDAVTSVVQLIDNLLVSINECCALAIELGRFCSDGLGLELSIMLLLCRAMIFGSCPSLFVDEIV